MHQSSRRPAVWDNRVVRVAIVNNGVKPENDSEGKFSDARHLLSHGVVPSVLYSVMQWAVEYSIV